MNRQIKPMEEKYLLPSADLVERVFTEYQDPAEGKVVRALVEGNPRNYTARGFEPSYLHNIVAGPNIKLPHPDCLMVKELVPGALESIQGEVDYSFYQTLLAGS